MFALKKEAKYKISCLGKTIATLKRYLLLLVPFLVILFLYEDASNVNSPRRGMYKNRLGIPDMNEWLMFEIV
jgi:hypothetical protein